MEERGQGDDPAGLSPAKQHCNRTQEAGLVPGPVWKLPGNYTPAGFEPQNFRPVTSLYSDDAIPAATIY